MIIKAADFHADWYRARADEFALYSRKQWEFCAIANVAAQVHPLVDALGFGCGRETLPAWLAARGVNVVATDRGDETTAWTQTGQHTRGLQDLAQPLMISRDNLEARVTFAPADMNAIPAHLRGFDFVWSCGSLEHLGGLDAGLRFICEAMRCLRPGGIAAHTTEYNPNDGAPTLESPDLSLYRRQELEGLAARLAAQGDTLRPIDYTMGTSPADHFIDQPPFTNYHLKIKVGHWTTTSILLIAQRGL